MSKKVKIICLFLFMAIVMIGRYYVNNKPSMLIANAKIYAEEPISDPALEGDMNKNGRIDLQDVIILLKKYLGIYVDDSEYEQILASELNADVEMEIQSVYNQVPCDDDTQNECGNYELQITSNETTFTVNAGDYDSSKVSGFVVYKKVDNVYVSVGTANSINGSVVIDTSEGIYVARVFRILQNDDIIYSDYSKELEISVNEPDHEGHYEFSYSTKEIQLFPSELYADIDLVTELVYNPMTCNDGDTQYECGSYRLQTTSNETTFTVNADDYDASDVDGFEVYKKVNEEYVSIGISNSINGSVLVDTLNGIYVARVFKLKPDNDKVYSDYSDELEISVEEPNQEGHYMFSFSTAEEEILPSELYATVEMTTDFVYNQVTCDDEMQDDCGDYELQVTSNETTFTINAEVYENANVSGFEVYKINNGEYVSVGISNSITGSVTIDTANGVYVARVFRVKKNKEKLYSDYSDELEIFVVVPSNEGDYTFNYSTENNEEEQVAMPELYANVEIITELVYYPITCNDGDTQYECGSYVLQVTSNETTFTINADDYSLSNVSGFEIYKKINGEYVRVETAYGVNGDVTIDTSEGIYVARAFKIKQNNQKVYSDYSDELEISVPSPSGVGRYVYDFSTAFND